MYFNQLSKIANSDPTITRYETDTGVTPIPIQYIIITENVFNSTHFRSLKVFCDYLEMQLHLGLGPYENISGSILVAHMGIAS